MGINKFNLITMAKKTAVKKTTTKKTGQKKSEFSNLFQRTPKNFSFGGAVQSKIDLTRFLRWPRYIKIQRQKRILMRRLKVPPLLNQFTHTADANQTKNLYRLLEHYPVEKKAEKKARLTQAAQDKIDGKNNKGKKPNMLKFGLNQVTSLVENNQAKLVVIAANVDPVELVCWLPALCRAKNVPFCIVKSQSVLGKFVGLKKTTCIAITDVDNSDSHNLETLTNNFMAQFNNNVALAKTYGKMTMGIKFRHRQAALQKIKDEEIMEKK